MGYSFRSAARVLLYASSHRQNNSYHSLCYTSHEALAGMRNSSMGSPRRIDPMTHRTMSERSNCRATSQSLFMQTTENDPDLVLKVRQTAVGGRQRSLQAVRTHQAVLQRVAAHLGVRCHNPLVVPGNQVLLPQTHQGQLRILLGHLAKKL